MKRKRDIDKLAADLIARLADEVADSLADERGASAEPGGRRYRDPRQTATTTPATKWARGGMRFHA